MFAMQPECIRARPNFRVFSNLIPEIRPMSKSVWEKAEDQLVRRWIKV